MKIAFLTHSIFNDGGVQRVVTTVANELSKKYEIDIICTNTKISEDRTKYGLCKEVNLIFENINYCNKGKEFILRTFRFLNRITGIFNNKLFYKGLIRIYYPKYLQKNIKNLILKNKYDLIIGCEGYYGLLMGVIKNDINSKVFSWQHNSYDVYLNTKGKYYWNENILFSNLLKKVDKNIVLTKYDKKLFEENLKVDSITIYNPLSFRCNIKSNQLNKIILCAGRLEERKGMDLLLKAFAKIDNRNGWKINIVGSGYLENYLKKLSYDLGIENEVKFIPFNKSIKEYMINSSIYAMPSRGEGFGLVVTEALEAGLPVVSFNTTGPSEILDGYNCGSIIKCFNIEEYSNQLNKLMNDDNMRKEYSNNAVLRSKDFREDIIIKEWENIIEN